MVISIIEKEKARIQDELPYDHAVPLLGIYLEKIKTLILKDTCTSAFIAAIFTTEPRHGSNLSVH